jgi:hypothetical protein
LAWTHRGGIVAINDIIPIGVRQITRIWLGNLRSVAKAALEDTEIIHIDVAVMIKIRRLTAVILETAVRIGRPTICSGWLG